MEFYVTLACMVTGAVFHVAGFTFYVIQIQRMNKK